MDFLDQGQRGIRSGSTLEEHGWGVLAIVYPLFLASIYLTVASVVYAFFVDADWRDAKQVAWLVIVGVLILGFARMQDFTGKWNGRFWQVSGIAYFGPPIVCNGLSKFLESMDSTTIVAFWVFKYRYLTGFVGAALVFGAYYHPFIVQWWKNRKAKKWSSSMRDRYPRVAGENPVPTVPPCRNKHP